MEWKRRFFGSVGIFVLFLTFGMYAGGPRWMYPVGAALFLAITAAGIKWFLTAREEEWTTVKNTVPTSIRDGYSMQEGAKMKRANKDLYFAVVLGITVYFLMNYAFAAPANFSWTVLVLLAVSVVAAALCLYRFLKANGYAY